MRENTIYTKFMTPSIFYINEAIQYFKNSLEVLEKLISSSVIKNIYSPNNNVFKANHIEDIISLSENLNLEIESFSKSHGTINNHSDDIVNINSIINRIKKKLKDDFDKQNAV